MRRKVARRKSLLLSLALLMGLAWEEQLMARKNGTEMRPATGKAKVNEGDESRYAL